MEVHPFANDYPLMPEFELAQLTTRMREVGFIRAFPIIRFQGKILDGRNRYTAAVEAKVDPFYHDFKGSEAEAQQFVIDANEHRRHLAPEWLSQRRKERIARVASSRRGGASQRQIAEDEEISQRQVQRDLDAAASTEAGGASVEPEGGKVTGQDGKVRTVSPKILCDRCRRVAGGKGVKGCDMCKALRVEAREKKKTKVVDSDEPTMQDAFGNDLPYKCRAPYGDGWIQQSIDFLAEIEEKVRAQRLADGMRKREKHYPFFEQKDFRDGVGFVQQYLDSLLKHLKDNRPAGVCPACNGARCAHCKNSGLVPVALYKKLKRESR